ncbi:hypothetical protein GCM10027266_26590 [Arenimonas alkanexedens]
MDCLQPLRPLSQTAWLHIVAERAWPAMGLTERIPGPPLRSERRPDGTVWIWSYHDPMRYDNEAAISGMRAFSDRMNAPT